MARRSANSRRLRRRNLGGRTGPYTDVRARTDWQLGGGIVTAAAPTPASSSSWGAAVNCLASTFINWQAVTLPEAVTAQAAPPGIGELQVDEIQGSMFFTMPAGAAIYVICVGIFVSKYNTNTGAWVMRAASVATEAMDDDWLYLRTLVVSTPATLSDYTSVEVALALPHPVILGRGEALHVTVDVGSAGIVTVTPFFRSRISNIS